VGSCSAAGRLVDNALSHPLRRLRLRIRRREVREYLYTLDDNQPPEGSDGLNDEELVQLGLQSGLGEACGSSVTAGRYLDGQRP
jgi:hypothetical protein